LFNTALQFRFLAIKGGGHILIKTQRLQIIGDLCPIKCFIFFSGLKNTVLIPGLAPLGLSQ